MRRSVIAALTAGLALTGIAIILILARSPLTVAGTNSIPGGEYIELEKGNLSTCQAAGSIPQGTSAVRIGIEGRSFNPAVTIRVLRGSRVLVEGQQAAGRGASPNVTVPVSRFTHAVDDAYICTKVVPAGELLRFYGRPKRTPNPKASPLQNATLHMEYLRPGPKSWWSLAPSIAYHMGLGHAQGGTWIVFFLLALMLAVVIVASRLTLKELR